MPKILIQKPQPKDVWMEEHGENLEELAKAVYRCEHGYAFQCQEEFVADYLEEAYNQYVFDFNEAMVNRHVD
jgi:hypothetical protein